MGETSAQRLLTREFVAQVQRLAGLKANIKAARTLELIAQRTAHGAAHDARDQDPAEVAAALGLTPDHAQTLLARFGRWNFHG